MEDLTEAIDKLSQVVTNTLENDPEYSARLNNLGVILESRFGRTGRMEDLEEAIQISRRAVEVTPVDHPNMAAWMNNLGTKLWSRFDRLGRVGFVVEHHRSLLSYHLPQWKTEQTK